ncbi:MAG TPA: Ig-like domain-containing protein, partial [Candidatus Acidoferrum sp.]|nr:Ig-like domain-containing protein [Candidatus Acidoferrum sp.]
VTTSMQFTPANVLASAHPTVIAAGPVGTDVPQNSSIGILFSEPVSRLGMPGGVKVLANGVAVSMPFNWTSETGLTLQPGWFLRAATTYTVTLSGFENLAGIPLPDFTWTFRTGSAIDTATPTLLRILPSGSNVSPDAAVAFAFDKAVAPDSAASHFSLAYAALSSSVNSTAIASTLGFSDDLRTVYLRPNAPLGAGASVNAAGGNVADFAGNTTGSAGFTSTFQVSYKGSAPAAVTGANPRPDSNGVPLNATIQVQYSARITLFSDIAATLTENGTPLDLTLRVAGDGRTLTLIPSRLLAANSLIDVTVTGVAPAACHFSFSTGTDPDLQSPAVTVWPTSELSPVPPSVVLRLRFSERLNPLTVSSDSVTLRAPNNALIDATASLDDSGRMVTLTPRLPLIEGQRYNASWSVGDLAGNLSTAGTYFTIGSPDNVPTTLRGIDPADGASDVSTRPLIQAFFTRPVEFTLGNDSFRLMADGVPVPGTIGIQGSQLSFNPTRALIPGAAYRIETRGMADVFGNAVPDAASTFTVASPGDAITQLRLLSSSPANGAVGIPADASIRLTFNKPVTTGSALALTASASYYGTNPYLSTRIEGNDVVIQPTAPFNGGSQVSVRGTLRDTAGSTTQVSFSYLVTPVPDNTPPVLEYMFPAAGSTVPISGVNLVLRFSEPVTFAPNAIRIIGGSNPDLTGSYLGADGRTLSMVLNLIADADITIALGNGVTDLAGNPMAPVSYQLHSLSAEESSLPKVKSITPPLGANDVPVDTPIQLQFTHAMEPVSTAVGLQVSADNVPVTGSAAVTPDAHGLQFKPDIPFRSGARVAATVRSPAQDTAGQRIEPFESYFTVVKDAILAEPAPLAISASASAIDVRFDAPLGRRPLAPYIRSGFALIPSHWELRGSDWLRVVPDQPLDPGRDYRLILDSQSEFPLHPHAPASAAMRSALYDGTAVRLRFDGEVNLLTVSAQTLQLSTPDGAKVAYYLEHSLDRRELVLRPATSEAALVLILNGSESAGGVPIPRQRHRLSAPK